MACHSHPCFRCYLGGSPILQHVGLGVQHSLELEQGCTGSRASAAVGSRHAIVLVRSNLEQLTSSFCKPSLVVCGCAAAPPHMVPCDANPSILCNRVFPSFLTSAHATESCERHGTHVWVWLRHTLFLLFGRHGLCCWRSLAGLAADRHSSLFRGCCVCPSCCCETNWPGGCLACDPAKTAQTRSCNRCQPLAHLQAGDTEIGVPHTTREIVY